MSLAVTNCTFSSSNKGTLSILTPGYEHQSAHIRRITIANLQITDTLVKDNYNNNNTIIDRDRIKIFQVVYTNLTINNCRFINNSAFHIFAVSSSLTLKATAFLNCNNIIGSSTTTLYLSRSSGAIDVFLLANSSAIQGAVVIEDSLLSISNSIFEGNSGTALYINTGTLRVDISNCTFRNNSGFNGGALYVENCMDVHIYNSSFSLNKAIVGGAIYCVDSTISTEGQLYSFSNYAENNGGHSFYSTCIVYNNNYGEYSNNQASNGGAIYAEQKTEIVFYNATMTNNIACKNGGALYLEKKSTVDIRSDPLILSNNVAKQNGGAIFVQDKNCDSESICFMRNFDREREYYIFTNNTAPQGPVLYGGLLDRCNVYGAGDDKLGIDVLKNISKYEHTPEAITSDPVRIYVSVLTIINLIVPKET